MWKSAKLLLLTGEFRAKITKKCTCVPKFFREEQSNILILAVAKIKMEGCIYPNKPYIGVAQNTHLPWLNYIFFPRLQEKSLVKS